MKKPLVGIMNSFPLVSIITPVYNQANYISETIESVISQHYPNMEYLVINDGSTDNTEELIKKYSDRILWETRTNMGENATVNYGVNKAKGEIIGIVNSDDPLLPGAITEIVKMFVEFPDVSVIYPDWKMIDRDGNQIVVMETPDYSYINMLRWHHCLPGPGTMFRKDFFQKLNGRKLDYKFVADFDFWLRGGLFAKFARIPKLLATHRWYAEGTSSAFRGIQMAEEHVRLIDNIYSLPNLPIEVIKIKKEAYSSAYFTAGICCGENLALKKEFYLKAIKIYPYKYVTEYLRRSLEMLKVFSPRIYLAVKLIIKGIKSIKALFSF